MVTPSRADPAAGPALVLLDAVLALAAWPIAVWLALAGLADSARPALPALAVHPLGCVLFLYALGLYRRDALLQTRRSLGRVPFAVLLGSAVASFAIAVLPPPLGAPGWTLLFAAAVPCFTLTACLARILVIALKKRGAFQRRLIVIGAGQRAFDLTVLLKREGGTLGYDIGLIPHPAGAPVDERLRADPTCDELPAEGGYLAAARAFEADQIVVAPDERRGLDMQALLACRTAGYPVQEYLAFLETEIGRIDIKRLEQGEVGRAGNQRPERNTTDPLADMVPVHGEVAQVDDTRLEQGDMGRADIKRLELGWLLYSDGFSFRPLDLALKRALDVSAAATLLVLVSPVLLAATLAVRLEDGGPALYRQARVTQGGRIFRIMKLRTMRIDAEKQGAVWAAARDPRITRIGNFLRRTRIDELPQLINVLRGDMSFVGPRPERPEFTTDLARKLPLYEERHLVRAGLTGWAQVNYPYGASFEDSRSKLSYDLYYVKNFGVLFDVLIILQTLRVVLWPGNTVR